MVVRTMPVLGAVATALLLLTGINCKVLVEDNCANQSERGNQFCRELYGNAAPYCSPCRRANNGCVETPPFSCQGYYDEVTDEDDEPVGTTTDDEPPPAVESSSDGTPMPGESSSGGGESTTGDGSGSETGGATE